ncbi:MAG: diphthine--ammonia ligase [Candidatus Aenigmarchaeota archaeon]|nr:diphthine--ammonia ligase [Candidatus Aenigmarchaeota archaeon]
MKLASLFSGGKDSTYSLFQAVKDGHEIKYLITFRPKRKDSYMFHHPCIELTTLQAESMGIKQIIVDTAGEKEKELDDIEKILTEIKGDIDGIVSGALASNYQKTRIDNICRKLGLESLAPLWKIDTEKYWEDLLSNNFTVMITSFASEGLNDKWLGRIVDAKAVAELKGIRDKSGLHLGFEGGEAESLVLDCPLFKKQLVVESFEKVIDKTTNSGYIKPTKAYLKEKLKQ